MGRSSQLVRVLSQAVMVMALCVGIGGMVSNGEDNDLMKQCTTAIQDLGNCLMFVTAKEAEPTKACCSAVSAMKDKQPVCLCLFIGQAHNGTNQALKGLGIQEARLLQLPNACHLTNASVTNCPKLLGISSSSPAAAIFMNNATSPAASTSPSSDPSDGFKLIGNGALLFVSLIVAIFITIIPIATLEISSRRAS